MVKLQKVDYRAGAVVPQEEECVQEEKAPTEAGAV